MLPSQDLNLAAKKYWSSTLTHLSGFFFWRGRALSQAIAILAKKTCWASSQELKTHIIYTYITRGRVILEKEMVEPVSFPRQEVIQKKVNFHSLVLQAV